MDKKLCIDCKYHRYAATVLLGDHYCYYPDWLSPVDGSPGFCQINRNDMYRCPNGSKWERKPAEFTPAQRSFWKKVFGI